MSILNYKSLKTYGSSKQGFSSGGLIRISKVAGTIIIPIYEGEISSSYKSDGSPVTLADEMADAYISEQLALLTPEITVISEESVNFEVNLAESETFWLVDPLDGTKEFINRNGEFTINIALIVAGKPILGVVYAPAIDCLYAGYGDVAFKESGLESARTPIRCKKPHQDGLIVVASRSHGDDDALHELLNGQLIHETRSVGSSLKLCLVAAGEADIYPRLGRTMEWGIAAGHAVVLAAGGVVQDLSGVPISYGKKGLDNPHFIAATSASILHIKN